jgi:hypothetical protein
MGALTGHSTRQREDLEWALVTTLLALSGQSKFWIDETADSAKDKGAILELITPQ